MGRVGWEDTNKDRRAWLWARQQIGSDYKHDPGRVNWSIGPPLPVTEKCQRRWLRSIEDIEAEVMVVVVDDRGLWMLSKGLASAWGSHLDSVIGRKWLVGAKKWLK